LPLENVLLTRPHSANLLHCRSPFLCALSTSIIGSVSHPAGDRPSHPNLVNKLTSKVDLGAGNLSDLRTLVLEQVPDTLNILR
jgi:hypothetical protein